jgi:MFS family permease
MGQEGSTGNRRKAYVGILLLGIVSLLGDVIYEGSRGIAPDYLGFLGATALVIGLVGGLGDFIGYAVRLVSGFLVDATRAYWLFIFLGYGLVVSIPLLGISTGLEVVIFLVLLERLGKALRAPSRDTVLSIVAKDVGTGKAFGFHELLDQVGAIIGPLLVAAMMFYSNNDYRFTFSFLLVPFVMLLVALVYAYRKIGFEAKNVEPRKLEEKTRRLPRSFYIYTSAVLLNTVGLIPYTLILLKASSILHPVQQQWIIPLIYMLIQGVDAPAAFLSGYAFDKFGLKVLIAPFLLSIFPPLLAMAGSDLTVLIAASVFFGLVLGMQESIYRAAVSELTPISSRGTAYGIFNAVYGVGFLISGAMYGLLIDYKISFIFTLFYALLMQILAIASLLNVRQEKERIKA